jgi:hypothetical protein
MRQLFFINIAETPRCQSPGRTYSPIWGHETSEGCDDGPQKANIIRWQAQKEIQDRDPKDGPA